MNEALVVNAVAMIGAVAAGLLLIAAIRLRGRGVRLLSASLMLVALCVGGAGFWYGHRPLPPKVQETLFPGIEYIRDVRSAPRPLVIHVVRIDLDTPGLRFFVAPGGENSPAQTVSQFLDQYDLQLAINGDFFNPWWDRLPWDYYPHVGDPVNPRGLTASEGKVVITERLSPINTTRLYITADNQVTFDTPQGAIYNAVSGYGFLVLDGATLIPQVDDAEYAESLHPRTAAGLDVSENTLDPDRD